MDQKLLFTKNNFNKKKVVLKNKVVGLCHGAFDILHLGHIKHLREAKKFCEILVVSITADNFIKKGPKQPFFSSQDRAQTLLAIRYVDHVYISNSPTGVDPINLFEPDFYIKGIDYINKKKDLNLLMEKRACLKKDTKLVFTQTKKYSSTKIINNIFNKYSADQIKIVKKVKKKYSLESIFKLFELAKTKTFAISGEPIFDEFRFVDVIGSATKSPIITSNYKTKEIHLGGSLAGAVMLSEFVKQVFYLLPINNKIKLPKFNSNVKKIFFNTNFKVPKKIRYLTVVKKIKLFQTNILNDFKVNKIAYEMYLKKINFFQKKYPFIMLDFGIGLFNPSANDKVLGSKFFLNVQTNSNNYGFNYFSKYKKFSYLSINLREFELNFGKKITHYDEIKNYIHLMPSLPFSVTLGQKGSVFVNKKKQIFYCPSFFSNTVDTTGCGDAYLIITSILVNLGYDDEIVPFIGNCYAGLHSQNFGNAKFPNKKEIFNFLTSLLNV
jgi:cytidyltransferase-like protein